MTRMVHPNDVAEVLGELAESQIRPKFRNLTEADIGHKQQRHELVTRVDIEVEATLEKRLPALLLGSCVIGEESLSRGDTRLDVLHADSPVWVVDPIDGTRNFVNGSELFATMVALVHKGVTLQSWIYDVMADRMFVAEKGSGASCNGHPIHSRYTEPITIFAHPRYTDRLGHKWENAQFNQLRATSHEYMRIANGEAQLSLYRTIKPWDHLAGVLLVKEAGGFSFTGERTNYSALYKGEGLITASTQTLAEKALATLGL